MTALHRVDGKTIVMRDEYGHHPDSAANMKLTGEDAKRYFTMHAPKVVKEESVYESRRTGDDLTNEQF